MTHVKNRLKVELLDRRLIPITLIDPILLLSHKTEISDVHQYINNTISPSTVSPIFKLYIDKTL